MCLFLLFIMRFIKIVFNMLCTTMYYYTTIFRWHEVISYFGSDNFFNINSYFFLVYQLSVLVTWPVHWTMLRVEGIPIDTMSLHDKWDMNKLSRVRGSSPITRPSSLNSQPLQCTSKPVCYLITYNLL